MRMPASLAALWGSTAFWVQQLGLWPCRTPPLGLGTVSLLLPWALGGCAVTSDPVRSEGRAGPSGWAQSPGLESPGRGVPGASCGGTPGGTPRPRTPLHLDKGPWSPSEAAPAALHPGQMARSLAELDERRWCSCRCAIRRPRRGPGARKAAGSVVCCDARLPFKWRSPRLGLLMGAGQSGFSLPAPAFLFLETNNKSFPGTEPPLSLGTGLPPTPKTPPFSCLLCGPGSLRSEKFSGLRGCETRGREVSEVESVQQPLDSHSRDGTTEANQIPRKLGVPRLKMCVGGGGCVSAQLCIRITGECFKAPVSWLLGPGRGAASGTLRFSPRDFDAQLWVMFANAASSLGTAPGPA